MVVVEKTHAGPEVRCIQFRMVLVLHGVINAVTLPHQVVMSAKDSGVHSGHIFQKHNNMQGHV